MKKNILLFCCFLCVLTSCKTLISSNPIKQTNQQVTIGSIGVLEVKLLKKHFKTTSFPSYREPVRVSAQLLPFNKRTYGKYIAATEKQLHKSSLLKIDSLYSEQNYVSFTITDRVSMINNLNHSDNKTVKDYLRQNLSAKVLIKVVMAFDPLTLATLQKADALFLVESSSKTYALQLYLNGKKTEQIPFSKGVVFGYETNEFCWQENNWHQLELTDIVSSKKDCTQKNHSQKKEKDVFNL